MAKQGALGHDDDDVPAGVVVEQETGEDVVLDDDDGKSSGKKGDDEDKDDEREGSGADDERLGADPEGESDEQRRERRRMERKKKRANKKEWDRRNVMELDFLRSQNENLEREMAKLKTGQNSLAAQTQISRVDSALNQLRHRLQEVDEVMAAAVTDNDGAAMMEAQQTRDQIRDKIAELNIHRRGLQPKNTGREEGEEEQGNRRETRTTNDEGMAEANRIARQNARIFASKHDWYDGENADSQKTLEVDMALRKEGFRHDQAAFWIELENRLKKRIPHRFKNNEADDDDDLDDEDDDDDAGDHLNGNKGGKNGARGGPVINGVKNGGGPGKPGSRTFHVSAARKKAMQDAGIWDDVPLRNKMLKRYAQYDKEHGSSKN